MGKLDGKIALITGGNSGIGLATAKRFVAEGAYVFITGRREAELAAAAKDIGRNSFARTWTTDLKPRRIRVNAISPGSTDTPGFTNLLAASQNGEQRRGMIATAIPLGRLGTPDENTTVFAISSTSTSTCRSAVILRRRDFCSRRGRDVQRRRDRTVDRRFFFGVRDDARLRRRHNCSVARSAPSRIALNFSHTTEGWTSVR